MARAAVEDRVAACVQIVPEIESVYRWQGALEESREVLLLFKTTAERLPDLERHIAELHSYETPEVLAVSANRVADRYLGWLRDSVRAED